MKKRFVSLVPALNPLLFFAPPKKTNQFGVRPASQYYYFTRNGIYAAARGLLQLGDEVLMPAYNSQTETVAMEALGLRMVYYDTDKAGQIGITNLTRLLTAKTKALYIIHYFGFAQPLAEIKHFAEQRNLVLLEDCALSLFSASDGRELGATGEVGFFCLRKYLPIPNAGALVVNKSRAQSIVGNSLKSPSQLSTFIELCALLLKAAPRRWPVTTTIYAGLRALVRTIFRKTKTDSGKSEFDISRAKWAMSGLSSYLLARLDYRTIIKARQENYFHLKELLRPLTINSNINFIEINEQPGFVPFCLPLLVDDNIKWSDALAKRGVEAGAWWALDPEPQLKVQCPNNAWLRKHILELPVHQGLQEADMEYIAEIVTEIQISKS